MKIVTLNTWGGRAGSQGLLDFFAKYRDSVDIFCLQEMWSAPYENLEGQIVGGVDLSNENIMTTGVQQISALLDDYTAYFRPSYTNHYGLMMLVKKTVDVIEEDEVFVYKDKYYVPTGDQGNHQRNIQYVKFMHNGTMLNVINFHGLWNGQGKTDTDDRILQSQKIIDFISGVNGDIVLCGDFNLLPDTQSLQMFRDFGLRDLVSEYNIQSTRTSLYKKPIRLADYAFTSSNLQIADFKVLPEEVSDHNALMIEIKDF